MSPRIKSKRIFDRDFQALSMLSMVSLSGFGLILLLVIMYAGWSSNESATARERQLLQNALNRGIARALNEQKSVAWWDDSVTKITDEAIDLDFVDSNFGVFLTETYGHDEVYILNGSNRPLYAFEDGARGEPTNFEPRRAVMAPVIAEVRGEPGATLKSHPDTFGSQQGSYRTLGGAFRIAKWAGHILEVDGRLSVVAAITIDPNVDLSLLRDVPNILISITHIDEEYVASIGRSLLLPDLVLSEEALSGEGMINERFATDDGTSAAYFNWTTQRPGNVLLTVILPLVALGVGAVALLAGGMLRRLRRTSQVLADREAEARHAATHDALSGLPNRTSFGKRLVTALETVRARGASEVVVAYLDLDSFKDVNDTLGHHAGDDLIQAVAERLQLHIRPGDRLFRYGGDEFAILVESAGLSASRSIADRVEKAFHAPFEVAGQTLTVTASVGIAVAPHHGATAEDLMRHADIALYQSKAEGRNRATLFTRAMARQVEERRAIELDLRQAVDCGELRLVYQPIIGCQDRSIAGVEALIRWRHPERGEISPAVFIPIAEQTGLMPALGEWVLTRAMQDARNWPELEVSVNLSPVQFRQDDIEARLRGLVALTGADPRRFVLEITEGVIMDASDRTILTLDAIREMGFRTALDDFGTGYSSLAYLCNYNFSKIKIDRSFVSGLSKSDRIQKIVQAVVSIGNGLGMEIVAEGVETESEVRTMSELGCTELQGYFFSRPLDVEPLKAFIAAATSRMPAAVLPLDRRALTAVG